ncbi:MAG TPA: hydantoinase B/oxoprolinase family protein [Gaiellaceae bacterium]|nr:hydantoinase B/oxoprolinase family protein [Gaiellaceae bacterium]
MTAISAEPLPFVLGPSPGDWDELTRELAVDPVTFEVVRHKLETINEEQGLALKAVSASPVVSQASDFGNGLYLPNGELVSMGPEIVFHAGAMPIVIRNVIADCAENPGIYEDDMFAVNDPYKGAIHHPDLCLVAPIHHQGEQIAWAGVASHQVDMGGMTVGSLCVPAREKQQEGLMLPPIKLVERGVVREDVWRLILNMTRQPEMVGLDLKGFVASNVIARRRLLALIDEYDVETVTVVMRELIRYSERRFRERLLDLPDGEFRSQGFLDHDGHDNRIYRTDVRLIKDGDTIRFDFSESSTQAPGFVNCTTAGLVGAVFGGLAPTLCHGIPWNQGIFNAIEIVCPEGLVCNATSPAPTSAATIAEAWMIVNTVVHATSKLVAASESMPERAQAITNGTFDSLHIGDRNQHGEPFGTHLMEAQLGGGGASAIGDGLDQSGGYPSLRPRIPNVESSEMHGPLLYLYRSYFPSSGGDGLFRGGRAAGLALTPYGVERLRCVFNTHGIESPVSLGLFGGLPGVTNRHTLIRATHVFEVLGEARLELTFDSPASPLDLEQLGGDVVALPAKTDELEVRPGDVLEYRWAGGGGFGDPLGRDPERVVRDVEWGAISRSHAETAYGVVLDGEHFDASATERLRSTLRRARLESADRPNAHSDHVQGEPVREFGPLLRIERRDGVSHFRCSCGHALGPASENWKCAAARLILDTPQQFPQLVVHEDLELVQYLCPGCGALLATEVEEKGAGPLHDVSLRAEDPS